MVSAERTVQVQLDAYNSHDLEAFLACYAEAAFVDDGDGRVLVRGLTGLRRVYGHLFSRNPLLHAKVLSRKVQNNLVVDTEQVSGFEASLGPPTVCAEVRYLVENQQIVHVRISILSSRVPD